MIWPGLYYVNGDLQVQKFMLFWKLLWSAVESHLCISNQQAVYGIDGWADQLQSHPLPSPDLDGVHGPKPASRLLI